MISFQPVRGSLLAIRRRMAKPVILSVLLGGIALATSMGSQAHDPSNNIVAHIQGMLQVVYANTGATEAQKTQLAALTQQASTDLAPVQDKMRQSHAQIFSLLTAETIDRGAIETARAAHMSAAEQESKRITQFVADVAETLTPAQRKALLEHLSHHGS